MVLFVKYWKSKSKTLNEWDYSAQIASDFSLFVPWSYDYINLFMILTKDVETIDKYSN